MEQLFALATVMVTVAFAVVYTIAALNGPSKVKWAVTRKVLRDSGGGIPPIALSGKPPGIIG
jgi:hypothetical protein